MQQRTHASFTKWWQASDRPIIYSFSPLRPQLRVSADGGSLEYVPDSVSMDPPAPQEQLQQWVLDQQQRLQQQTADDAVGAAVAGAVAGGSENATHGIAEQQGVWDLDRYLSLLLGEIPRLRDGPSGYGPRGKGFIEHVDIPPEVEEAHAWLAGRYPQLLRL